MPRLQALGFLLLLPALAAPAAAGAAPNSRKPGHSVHALVHTPGRASAHASARASTAKGKHTKVTHTASGENVRLCRGADARRAPGEPEKVCLELPDLKDEAQTRTLTVALAHVAGVRSTIVDLNTRLAVVDFDPDVTGLTEFVAACREAGFSASEYQVERRFPKPIKLKGG